MCTDPITLVPLLDREGRPRAYALIDSDEADWVSQFTWAIIADGRPGCNVSGETFYLYRLIMNIPFGDPRIVDHINRIPTDCRKSNLRLVTHAENRQNLTPRTNTSSKHRGVSWKKPRGKKQPYGYWVARATINGVMHHLGYFEREEDAAKAAQEGRARLMSHAHD